MPTPAHEFADLVDLVARLRAPDGCPWDREQRLVDLRAYLIEEAHEAAAALDSGDWSALAEELGDLLFQVAFLIRLGEEAGATDPSAVIAGVAAKMIARHPHVFGEARLADAAAVRAAWERRKLEKSEAAARDPLGGVPSSLPALVGAYRLTQKAAGVGFDWPDATAVLAKVDEELGELRAELAADDSASKRERLADEIGDLLFTVVNLARRLEVDPEAALATTNRRFRRRFAAMANKLAERGSPLGAAPLEELDRAWEEAKRDERAASDR